jgi:hypothetical protein
LESSELPVSADEAFLNHVFGVLLVAGHSERQPVRITTVAFHERAKRVAVALAGSSQGGCRFAGVHLLLRRQP